MGSSRYLKYAYVFFDAAFESTSFHHLFSLCSTPFSALLRHLTGKENVVILGKSLEKLRTNGLGFF